MHFNFTKMHGLGNDFIVIDAINQTINLTPNEIRRLSDRYTGIGFDQCLIVEKSTHADIDFFYRIFNANGDEVGQCGNGARCLARFIHKQQLSTKSSIKVATKTVTMQLQLHDDDSVSVILPKPQLDPHQIPLIGHTKPNTYTLKLQNNDSIQLHAINVGNPHAVLVVPTWPIEDLNPQGHAISTHQDFPEQTNVGFMYIDNPSHIFLRVYERGCGETQACGSGAVAAMAIGRLYYNLNSSVTVSLLGGDLLISWPDLNGNITLRGPASFVYDGKVL